MNDSVNGILTVKYELELDFILSVISRNQRQTYIKFDIKFKDSYGIEE